MGSALTTDDSACVGDEDFCLSPQTSPNAILPSLDKCNTNDLIKTIKKYSSEFIISSSSSSTDRQVIDATELRNLSKTFIQYNIKGGIFLPIAKDYLNNKSENEISDTRNEVVKYLSELTNLDPKLLENCTKLIIEKKIKEDVEELKHFRNKKSSFEQVYLSLNSQESNKNVILEDEEEDENLFNLKQEITTTTTTTYNK
ncbi:hypothetical protein ABK040_011535 [Willaertia magna]